MNYRLKNGKKQKSFVFNNIGYCILQEGGGKKNSGHLTDVLNMVLDDNFEERKKAIAIIDRLRK